MKRVRGLAVVAAVGGLGAVCGSGAPAHAAAMPSFSGSCEFPQSTVLSDFKAGFVEKENNLLISGPGRCTGDASGTVVQNTLSSLDIRVTGRIACQGTNGFLLGTARLEVGKDTVIPLQAAVRITAVDLTVRLTGGTGRADGRGSTTTIINVITLRPPPVLEGDFGCFTQTQRRSAFGFRLDAASLTPFVEPTVAAPACTSTRRFRIKVRPVRGVRSARVTVAGRQVPTRRLGGRITALIDLRGRDSRLVTVRTVAKVVRGQTTRSVTKVRRYRPCVPGR